MAAKTFRVTGRVVDVQNRRGLPGLNVEVWARDRAEDDLLGSSPTDDQGVFRIEPAAPHPFGRFVSGRLDLFFRVYQAAALIHSTEDAVMWNVPVGDRDLTVDLEVEQWPQGRPPFFRVKGQVRGADGQPLAGAIVRAVDRDLRSEQPLGEDTTKRDGRYEIRYKQEHFSRAEKARADLVVTVLNRQGQILVSSPVIFNAPPLAVVNLSVAGDPRQSPSEYERLADELRPLLEQVPANELTAQDVAFLVGETGISAALIEHFAQAHRLAKQTEVPAEAFFGFFRQDLPTELPALLSQGRDAWRGALEAALAANIVPATLRERLDAILARLAKLVEDRAFEPPGGDGGASLSQLLAPTLPTTEQQRAFVQLYANYSGEDFWGDLRQNPEFAAHVDSLQFTMQAGVLTQNNPPLIQKLQEMRASGTITGLRDLVRLDIEEWKALIAPPPATGTEPTRSGPAEATGTRATATAVSLPPYVPGETEAERVTNYATVLTHMVQDAFPTAAIAHRLSTDAQFPGQQDLTVFFEQNPEFEFRAGNVDGYLAQHPGALDGVSDRAGTEQQLKSTERLVKVTPRYDEVRTLAADGVDSAYAIWSMGPSAFTATYAPAVGGEARAQQIYAQAAQTSATALTLLADYAAAFNPISLNVLPFEEAQEGGVPNWKTLFGSVELCACKHCRSVLSPAAYLTDILHFLKDRPAKAAGTKAKDVLLARRPDLAEIELTCENTNTPLPYVDLVNEILGNAVAPAGFTLAAGFQADLDAGTLSAALRTEFRSHGFLLSERASVAVVTTGQRWHVVEPGWRFPIAVDGAQLRVLAVPQTAGEAADLAANPEHVNPAAYDRLRQEVFPWQMPFDLWAAEARAYLGHLGVPRHELMETFQRAGTPPDPTDLAIATESLGLTTVERQIIAGAHPDSGPSPWKFWGFGTAGTWVDELKTVRTLLDRAGLTYAELEELLRLTFINPDRRLVIASSDPADPHTCATEKLQIAALTADALNRIHRFVRLWRKLGWTARELDTAITALKPAALNDDFLRSLAHIQTLRADLSLPVVSVLGWYARLDTAAYPDTEPLAPRSLYEELFQDPAVIKLAPGEEDPFALNAARAELKTIRSLSILATDPDAVKNEKKRLRATISAALRLSGTDLSELVDGPQAVVTADKTMTLENLSRLYRMASLARALKLKVEDLLAVRDLTAMNPFVDDDAAVTPADTKNTRAFMEKVRTIRDAGYSVAALDYLLRHRFVPSAGVAPREEAIAAVLEEIRTGLASIAAATAAPSDPTGEELTRQLAVLGWDGALVREAVDTVGRRITYEAPLDPMPAVALPPNIPVSYDAAAKKLRFAGAMTDAQKTALLALSDNAAYQGAVNSLFNAPRTFVQERMKTFVDPVYETSLAGLPASVRFPAPLAEKVSYDSDARALRFRGPMTTTERDALLALSTSAAEPHHAAYQAAVTQLFNAPATHVPPPEDRFLTAADADFLFETARPLATPPRPAQANFEYVLARLAAHLRRTGSESLVKQSLSEALRLGLALTETLLTRWQDQPADPAHRPMAEFLAPDFGESTDKVTAARFPALFRTYVRLQKVAGLIAKLGVTSPELSLLLEH
ncbi:MAG TPA: Tc toxin subunit A, partial [Herpetosiphonaceae bacterium]|nr:Tc toxin subunit A [Herpetosiphonaceae bacterium]